MFFDDSATITNSYKSFLKNLKLWEVVAKSADTRIEKHFGLSSKRFAYLDRFRK